MTGLLSVACGTGAGSDKVNVWQAGWNVLDVFDGFEALSKNGGAVIDVSWEGRQWRSLNDRLTLNRTEQDTPIYKLRSVRQYSEEGVSPFIHWPNGIKYQFSGQAMGVGDRWELSRQVISDTSYLMSSRLHGVWYTQADGSAVYIWADAEDSNMDKFLVNCFMVLGSNTRKVTLVGKDTIGAGWTEIAELDLKRYALQGLTHIDADGVDVVSVNGAKFLEGTFERGFKHYYEAAGNRNAEVKKAAVSEIVLDSDVARTETEATIFRTDGVKVLDEEVSYRYIGLKLDDASTAEGYYLLHTFDFGYSGDVFGSYRHKLGGGMFVGVDGNVNVVTPQQLVRTKSIREKGTFTFEFAFVDSEVYANVLALVDKVSRSSRPVWVYKDGTFGGDVWLCLIDRQVDHGVLTDENGEKYYSMTISLRSVS